jgi:hypothetical protein
MTDPRTIRDDLEPGAPEDLVRLAERLQQERPLPSPTFRGQLRRRLEARSHRALTPARARTLIAGYASAGTLLLLIGAISAAGGGPLGG